MLYVISTEECSKQNICKIGITTNLGRRITQLPTAHYQDLCVYYDINTDNDRDAEDYVKRKLNLFHERGEWYCYPLHELING